MHNSIPGKVFVPLSRKSLDAFCCQTSKGLQSHTRKIQGEAQEVCRGDRLPTMEARPGVRLRPTPGTAVRRYPAHPRLLGARPRVASSRRLAHPRHVARASSAEVNVEGEDNPTFSVPEIKRADELVRYLWTEIDLDDSEAALPYFDDDVVYEDLIYGEPFEGKAAVADFLRKTRAAAPKGLKFVLDDISDGAEACGFTWHIELPDGKSIAKGLSFYRVNPANGKIVYVRDAPEAMLKLGGLGLKLADVALKVTGGGGDGSSTTTTSSDASSVDDVIKEGFEKVGFRGGEGVRVKWGIIQEKIPETEALPSEEEQAARRARAAADLVNIDGAERRRRATAGLGGLALTTIVAFALQHDPWYVRYFGFSTAFGLSAGFLLSGATGL